MNLEEIKARAEAMFQHPVEIKCECGHRVIVKHYPKGYLTILCGKCKQGVEIDLSLLTQIIPALIAEVELKDKKLAAIRKAAEPLKKFVSVMTAEDKTESIRAGRGFEKYVITAEYFCALAKAIKEENG